MNIGIDLDNTIIDYSDVFIIAADYLKISLPECVKSKFEIREFLRSTEGGESTWQRIQGIVYGKFLNKHAKIFPGLLRFLWRCREKGYEITIVSHKTEFGNYDIDEYSLRDEASSFLFSQSITSGENPLVKNVFFHNNYLDKINFIKHHNFDWFIDDLEDVIIDLCEIDNLNLILFNTPPTKKYFEVNHNHSISYLDNWQIIDSLINGSWSNSEINNIAHQLTSYSVKEFVKINNGGNGGVYKLILANNQTVKLKIYPIDLFHDRLYSELVATNGIIASGLINTPKIIAYNLPLNICIFDWLEGDRVISIDYNYIDQCLSFLTNLHSLRYSSAFVSVPLASSSCFSGLDIERQINNRVAQFKIPRLLSPDLDSFFVQNFLPFQRELFNWARFIFSNFSDFDIPISINHQTLSPSDFGFHNSIRDFNGILYFIDFEYFGWDDPVKLISDFIFHPGMSLTNDQISYWQAGALKIYGEDLIQRLNIFRPLYGLIWCLIILNDFRLEVWDRRVLSDESKKINKKEILLEKLNQSIALLNNLKACHYEKLFEVNLNAT